MNKMNKKGFTLIEMLVVIAIIAVLVSIIIPTVSSATDKAAAATNAANLRSLIAEATTKYLSNDQGDKGNVQVTITVTDGEESVEVTMLDGAPKSVKCDTVAKGVAAELTWDSDKGSFTAKYGDYTLADYQAVAAGDYDTLAKAAAANNAE